MHSTTLIALLATLALGACASPAPAYKASSYAPAVSRTDFVEQRRRSNLDEAKQEAETARQAIASGTKAPLTIAAAKSSVTESLRDPESARFRDVRRNTANGAVCGYVNAKNAYGGYVGESPFIYYHSSKYSVPQLMMSKELVASTIIPYTAALCPADSTTVTTDGTPPARRARRS